MPLLRIQTNRDIDARQRQELAVAASKTTADLLGKPENYVMVVIEPATSMLFAGSDEATAYLELKSINLPEDDTTRLSQGLCQLMEQHLGIPAARVYVEFANAQRHLWGFNGATF